MGSTSSLVEKIRGSPVVYPDETGWKQGGRKAWLWVVTNLKETVYAIKRGRGYDEAVAILGEDYSGDYRRRVGILPPVYKGDYANMSGASVETVEGDVADIEAFDGLEVAGHTVVVSLGIT